MKAGNTATIRTDAYRFSTANRLGRIVLEIERHVNNPIYQETVPIYLTPPQAKQLIGLLMASVEVSEQQPDRPLTRWQEIAANVRRKFGYTPGGDRGAPMKRAYADAISEADLVDALDCDLEPMPQDPSTLFTCRGCGKRTLGFGDFPYCSYVCRFTPRPLPTSEEDS